MRVAVVTVLVVIMGVVLRVVMECDFHLVRMLLGSDFCLCLMVAMWMGVDIGHDLGCVIFMWVFVDLYFDLLDLGCLRSLFIWSVLLFLRLLSMLVRVAVIMCVIVAV